MNIVDEGELKDFELHRPILYVAVYFYENSDTPYSISHNFKEELLKSLISYKPDPNRPVRIYTIKL
jgi:hypothetical protein